MRYFFNLENGVCVNDPEGDVLRDDAAAREEAVRAFTEIIPLRQKELWAGEHFSIVVRDERDGLVATLTATMTVER